MNDYKLAPESYLFNGQPLQHKFNNNYSKAEMLEITINLNKDYESGQLSAKTLSWIIDNKRFGDFTAKVILDKMLAKGIIKENPVTKDAQPNFKPKTVFDW